MKKQKIFLCYTLRGADLTRALLERFKRRMQATGFFEIYIDVLDNNDNDNPQRYVMERLHDADLFCVIHSKMIEHSEWVQKELAAAESLGMSKVTLTVTQIKNFLDIKSDEEILICWKRFIMLSHHAEARSEALGYADCIEQLMTIRQTRCIA